MNANYSPGGVAAPFVYPQSENYQERLVNGDFSSGLSNWFDERGSWRVADNEIYEGVQCESVLVSTASGVNTRTQGVNVQPGEVVRLSAVMTRTVSVSYILVYLHYYDSLGNLISSPTLGYPGNNYGVVRHDEFGFQELIHKHVVPAGAVSSELWLQIYGRGVGFDSVSVGVLV